ncbi:MAG: hypothetical protein ACE5IJ_12100, partial [Thermoplasmata archaeon]
EVSSQLPAELTLCSFDQTTRDTELRFKLKGSINHDPLEVILTGSPIVYRPELVHSRHKFVRGDPPTIYTAFEVWLMLPTFQNIRTAHEPSFIVNRQALLERARVFYPPWIRNNMQINANRVNHALSFLNEIDFVDWEPGEDEIVVYSTRGTRSGDLLEYFAERWTALLKKPPPRGVAVLSDSQKTLADFG